MSNQLESKHHFLPSDLVRDRNGREGRVVEGWALYARVRWADGVEEEVEQFDPRIIVVERGGRG